MDSSGCYIRACFLDFSKTFDRIDYNLVIIKLLNLEVWRSNIPWICSFLSRWVPSVCQARSGCWCPTRDQTWSNTLCPFDKWRDRVTHYEAAGVSQGTKPWLLVSHKGPCYSLWSCWCPTRDQSWSNTLCPFDKWHNRVTHYEAAGVPQGTKPGAILSALLINGVTVLLTLRLLVSHKGPNLVQYSLPLW